MLNAEQLDDWERDGFLVLPEFFDRTDCDGLKAHVESMLAEIDPQTDDDASVFSTTKQSHAQDDWFLGSGDTIRWFFEDGAIVDGELTRPMSLAVNKLGHAMHDLDPVFGAFTRRPELAEVVADIGIADPKLLQSMYIFKQPGIGGEVTCHTDHTFLWTEPQSVIGFWVAIEDATVDNGCMWAIPGGHHIPVKSRFRLTDTGGTTNDIFDDTSYLASDLVPLEAETGTLIVLHGTLPHWSAPNTSDVSRHAYTLHVIDGEAEYLANNWLQRRPEMPLRGF
ncbi:MAG: phytanoyl-CoA dioxygenase family protein [Acidimicrobiaceae bacterium]|jgi:phytanoyl-CoA hydroxylase|nr:phytanoyl-CoA dioxygenase family protein [Acidimicrobiaceae bacterium]MBT5581091.1 phytanoyl-CoA dioxygenase family protein [Acidimicrobiaceae bacterium]MDG1411915.1 phytanoyl-CoA dioxygenase family protein [Acidimicrobiales bacterium]MDG2217081.1 phytanoyl-CoA dioxygenase family protein [Acidimicrobiales bacterium]